MKARELLKREIEKVLYVVVALVAWAAFKYVTGIEHDLTVIPTGVWLTPPFVD